MGKRPSTSKHPTICRKARQCRNRRKSARKPEPDPERLDPVRYGDWELKGVAVDF